MNTKQLFGQGEIPKQWDIRTIDDIGKVVTGNTPSTSKPEYYGGKNLFVKPSDLGNGVYISDTQTKLSNLGFKRVRKLPKTTVMVTCIGSIGKMGIANTILATNQQINSIITTQDTVSEYIFYNLRYRKKFLESYANRSLLPIINKTDFEKIKIPVPPLVEQHGIVEVLRTVDECILYTDLVIEKTEELKRGFMQQLLTKGIGHTEFNETSIGKLPKTWKTQNLSNLVSYKNGIYKPAKYYGKGNPSIRMHNISNGKIVSEGAPLLSVDEEELKQFGLNPGDIVVNRVNSLDLVGKCGIVGKNIGPATFESKNIRLRVTKRNIIPEFLNFVLNTEKKQHEIRRYAKAAVSQATITQDDLSKLIIPLPPIEEQKQILKILTMVQEKIESERLKREQMINLKKGLMQILLSGKVRVELGEDGLHRIRDS